MSAPVISIICNTFNHEKYIRDALEGFLSQKVSVPFEILVHDDASTDATADMVRTFEAANPGIVKPIYQTENQYSKKVAITPQIQLPRALGKYVAFCEGDDYWTDPEKLQVQYDFMEAHPEYSGCCHAYSMVDKDGTLLEERRDLKDNGVVPISKLLGNQLEVPHFATLFLRRDCLEGLGPVFLGKRCNDMVIRMYCAAKAPLFYLNRNMSCYRRFTERSWTVRVGAKIAVSGTKWHKANMAFLKEYDAFTEGRFHDEVVQSLDWREFEIAWSEGRFREAHSKMAYRKASFRRRMAILAGCICPWLVRALKKWS